MKTIQHTLSPASYPSVNFSKKFLALATIAGLAAAGVVTGQSVPAHASPVCGVLDGDGFHLITSLAELEEVGSGGTGTGECDLGAKYLLTVDITLPAPVAPATSNWTEIDEFAGTFDGGGKTITGLTLSGDDVGGMFRTTTSASILRNINLAEVNISTDGQAFLVGTGALVGATNGEISNSGVISGTVSGTNSGTGTESDGIGGLVGLSYSNGSITGSFSRATVDAPNFSNVGGLVGSLQRPLQQSYATGDVTGGQAVGGLVGLSTGGNNKIHTSFARGDVTATNQDDNTGSSAGGLVGQNGAGADDAIRSSYATGSVSSDGVENTDSNAVGGLVGYHVKGGIQSSYSTGPAATTGGGTSKAGGLVGESLSVEDIDSSFWDVDSSELGTVDEASGSDGGVGKSTDQLTIFDTFGPSPGAEWAIVDGWAEFAPADFGEAEDPDEFSVWGICADENSGYPFLLWEYSTHPCPNTEESATETAGTKSIDERVDDPGIHLDVQGAVGEEVAGSSVVVGGQGLASGSTYTLILRSTAQVLVSGEANAAGNFSQEISMPESVNPGRHSLTLTAVALDGGTLTLVTGFVVSPTGVFSSVEPNSSSTTPSLAATGPAGNLLWWGTGFAALLMFGGFALIGSRTARSANSRT